MTPRETVILAIGILHALFVVAAAVYGLYAVYYAYFMKKDEREKFIVLRSGTHAFAVVLVYFILQFFVQFANHPQVTWLWEGLHFGNSSAVATGMVSVLGICLFINKRRMGGG